MIFGKSQKSKAEEFLPRRKQCRLTEDRIMKLVRYHYRKKVKEFYDMETYKDTSIDIAVPLNPRVVSESCMLKIHKMFNELGWKDNEMYIGPVVEDWCLHINLKYDLL